MRVEPFDGFIRLTSPHRLCETQAPRLSHPNPLFFPLKLDMAFGDIHQNLDMLESLYVSARVPAAGLEDDPYPPPMNKAYPSLYTDNILTYIGDPRLMEPEGELLPEVEVFLKTVEDQAQVSLVRCVEGLPPDRRMLVIMGGIGCGKTTFIQHTFSVLFQSLPHGERYELINCDYRVLPPPSAMDLSSLGANVRRQLMKRHPEYRSAEAIERVLQSQIADFSGVYDFVAKRASARQAEALRARHLGELMLDNLELAAAVICDLQSRSPTQFVIALDNMDQHSAADQLSILRFAKSFLNRCPKLLVLVCIREYTLPVLWDELRTMHVYAMHMTSPPLDTVLKKRFRFAAEQLDRSDAPWVELKEGINIQVKSYKKFLAAVSDPLLDRQTVRALYHLSSADLREAIDLVKIYLQSPHLPVVRLVPDFYTSRAYDRRLYGAPWKTVPFDCFLKTIILKRGDRYDERDPVAGVHQIIDVFCDPDDPHPERSLLRYRLLDYIQRRGVVSKWQLVEDFEILEPKSHLMEARLQFLMYQDFIESPQGRVMRWVREIFATRRSWYYIHKLSKYLTYLGLVRNHMCIDYEADAPDPSYAAAQNLPEVIALVDFIRRKEILEKERVPQSDIESYKLIVGYQPVSWKILRSVCRRILALLRDREVDVTKDLMRSVARLYKLQERIKADALAELLLPEIPAARMTSDCWELLPAVENRAGECSR